jgi:uncharacterized membrane protein YdjX (TVP38/TMEM64 family)
LASVKSIAPLLRDLGAAVATAIGQIPRGRAAALAVTAVAVVALAALVPLPTALQMRDWATGLGPWFPLAFFAAHVVVTVFPFPRTAFTLSAGLMFGSALGIGIALTASTVSAMIALLLIRAAGWQLTGMVRHARMDALNSRLRQRGWLTVISMRLIPAVPFSVLNYAAGASAIRWWPYTVATFVGLLPGTAAVVVFGDALTGTVSPALLVVSAVTAALGAAGLVYEIRSHRSSHRAQTGSRPAATESSKPAVNP